MPEHQAVRTNLDDTEAGGVRLSALRFQVREVAQLPPDVSQSLKLIRNSTGFQSDDKGFESPQRLQDDCGCPDGAEEKCINILCPRK